MIQKRNGTSAGSTSQPAGYREAVDGFLAEALSTNTYRAYRRWLELMPRVHDLESFEDLSEVDLGAWVRYLQRNVPGAKSREQGMTALRSFLLWSCRNRLLVRIDPERVRQLLPLKNDPSEPSFRIVPVETCKKLLDSARPGLEKAIVGIVLGAGLTPEEIIQLDCTDLKETGQDWADLDVRRGTTRPSRVAQLRREVADLLMTYLAMTGRASTSRGPLFLSEDRGAAFRDEPRLSTSGIRQIVGRISARLPEDPGASPRDLRNTFAVYFLAETRNESELGRRLGISTQAAQRYWTYLERQLGNLMRKQRTSRSPAGSGTTTQVYPWLLLPPAPAQMLLEALEDD